MKGKTDMSRKAIFTWIIALAVIIFFGYNLGRKAIGRAVSLQQFNIAVITADAAVNSGAYSHFSQTLLLNTKAKAYPIDNLPGEVWNSEIIYLDKSVIKKPSEIEQIREKLADYAKAGGGVFLENSFAPYFSDDFLGGGNISEIKIDDLTALSFPETETKKRGIPDVLKDYAKMADNFKQKPVYNGYGMDAISAEVLASYENKAVLTLNNYGKGRVMLASPILPDENYITSFDMKPSRDIQTEGAPWFNPTASASTYLFRNEFAAFIQRDKQGFSAKKVIGAYGSPPMAWQNHIEEISAIAGGAMSKWVDILKEYRQIPSYYLIRSPYKWGQWY
jgi:hypothetical protein